MDSIILRELPAVDDSDTVRISLLLLTFLGKEVSDSSSSLSSLALSLSISLHFTKKSEMTGTILFVTTSG